MTNLAYSLQDRLNIISSGQKNPLFGFFKYQLEASTFNKKTCNEKIITNTSFVLVESRWMYDIVTFIFSFCNFLGIILYPLILNYCKQHIQFKFFLSIFIFIFDREYKISQSSFVMLMSRKAHRKRKAQEAQHPPIYVDRSLKDSLGQLSSYRVASPIKYSQEYSRKFKGSSDQLQTTFAVEYSYEYSRKFRDNLGRL